MKFFTPDNVLETLENSTKRDDLYKHLNNSLTAMKKITIPILKNASEAYVDKDITIADIDPLETLNKEATIGAKTPHSLFERLLSYVVNMEATGPDLLETVNNDLPEVITKDSITVKQVTVITLVYKYQNVVEYIPDFLRYVITLTDRKLYGNRTDSELTKHKIREVNLSLYGFVDTIRFFKDNKRFIRDIKSLSNELVEREDVGIMSRMFKDVSSLGINGFNMNPVYHIRLAMVDRQMRRRDNLLAKQKEIEYRLMDLKREKDEKPDKDINSQIEYYEDLLDDVEFKIRDIEDK